MRMGSMTEVARDESVAMRIRFEGTRPSPSQMYFRGPVLTRFDGLEWRPLGLPFAPAGVPDRPPALTPIGEPIRYEATLEPLRVASLPLLEATTEIAPVEGFRFSRREDLQWLGERPIYERIRVKAEAYPRYVLTASRRSGEIQESLELPPGFNPRTLAWTRALRDQPANRGLDATGFSNLVLRHIREGGYDYTLSPGEYGRDAVDEFWLDRKTGFCEHFAAAYVVVMRAAGFPARIVTGYQGSDSEPVDGFFIVRQSSAHAWAEYWQNGQGLDPRRSHRRRLARPDRQQHPARDAAGSGGRRDRGDEPGALRQPAQRLGGGQQPLEPVGAQLHPRPAARRAEEHRLRHARLGGPGAAADRHPEHAGARRRHLGMARPAPGRPLGAPARAAQARPALARHRRRAARSARAPSRRGCAIASATQGEPLAAALDALETQRYGRAPASRPDAALTRRFAADSRRLRSLLAR